MVKLGLVIVVVGFACAAPVVPTRRPCADGHVVFANGRDTSPDVESASSAERRRDYAIFFKRLKSQVSKHWQPGRVWERRGARTAAPRTWITEVAVSLARNGRVLAVCVLSPSGNNELDEEALRAFWAAAPFRDPPVGLFECREHVTFPFGFYFGDRTPNVLRAPML